MSSDPTFLEEGFVISQYTDGDLRSFERMRLEGGMQALRNQAGAICGEVLACASFIAALSTETGDSAREIKEAVEDMAAHADELKAGIAKLGKKADEMKVQEGLLRDLR